MPPAPSAAPRTLRNTRPAWEGRGQECPHSFVALLRRPARRQPAFASRLRRGQGAGIQPALRRVQGRIARAVSTFAEAAIFTPTSIATGPSASHSSRYAYLIVKTTIQADLPPELTARALTFVQEGWASDFNELLADALRRFLESHSARVTEAMVMSDVQWGLRGND